ncbi:MAG: hypothetical protein AAF841_04950 [Pseudomonadota bacterium]
MQLLIILLTATDIMLGILLFVVFMNRLDRRHQAVREAEERAGKGRWDGVDRR